MVWEEKEQDSFRDLGEDSEFDPELFSDMDEVFRDQEGGSISGEEDFTEDMIRSLTRGI